MSSKRPAIVEISTPSALLAEGLKRHAAGNLGAAARCYQQILQESPRNPDALLLLGIVARQAQQHKQAIALTKAAIEQRPAPHYFVNLAHAYRCAGDPTEAEKACRKALALGPKDAATHCWLAEILLEIESYDAARRSCEDALALQPNFARAHHGLGNIHSRQGNFPVAAVYYRRAVALDSHRAEFHFGLGYALHRLGQSRDSRNAFVTALKLRPHFAEAHLNLGNLYYSRRLFPAAAAHYQSALRVRPGYAKACNNLGNAFARLNRITEAIACYRRALLLKPGSAIAYHGLGNALAEKKQWAQALQCLQRAIEVNPVSADIHNSLGNLHYSQRKMEDAALHYRRAIEIDSTYARAHVNLGNSLLALGRHAQARSMYERGLALDPASPDALYNLALARLRNGEFARGWREYESRWIFEELHLRPRNFRAPLWRGEPLEGKTILLHAEQGLGDTIQFARFVPLVAARGGRVILEVQPPLLRLLQSLPGVEKVIPRGAALPALDCHCPLMSLPLALGTTLETIPSPEGYLQTDPDMQLPALSATLRVGIAWAGNPHHKGDVTRSMPLEALTPLANLSGLSLISLQKGAGLEQLAPLKDRLPIHDAAPAHVDMLETAGLVGTLDLVLSVDTSIAHLAGAMAKPVWIMLPWVADWRWMEQRSDSPWYRSARLFRQSAAGDWSSVVHQIIAALQPSFSRL